MGQRTVTDSIRFDATVEAIDQTALVRLPHQASQRLPSRGQVAVHGSVNDQAFSTVVEPDGARGHWIRLDPELQESAGLIVGEDVQIVLEVTKDWPEPEIPRDLASALAAAPEKIHDIWDDITPMARWEWVRWVNATANPDTRQRRVEVTISKIDHGKRRPCCFDLSSCTDPSVATSGRLRPTS